ncbi:hypothetical protein SO802_033314 [Lithocarpus litseifolius]|uniref:glutathione transferase n=1 Tax=Lithocarpus litseifolius TaxID=425828 RepID=A0AAW2BFP1_9ROSI
MALKLYGLPMSTCTTRVLACLHEKGVDFELVPVDLFSGEHKQPPFLSKNPFGQIPVLEDGDLTLFESRAITAYVAEKFKETGTDLIKHNNPKEAALVKVWMEVESLNFNSAISPIVFEHIVGPIMGKTADQAVIDANLEKLGKVLDVYESKLSITKYLAGDFYSLADLHHFPYTHYFMTTPWASLVNDRPHVKAWWEDISSRPAFKKIVGAMTFGEGK